jgi:iron(III) transport system ATP-binding protein
MELKIKGLSKQFQSFDQEGTGILAVNNVDLEVGEGELVTLLGPSGCGKTTLLRMIAGFEDPTSGDIYFGSKRMNDIGPNKRNTTLVFQSYAIFPHLNVYENIAFGLRLKKMTEEEISRKMELSLELVGLKGLENRQPSQLSGGQQQRVALARAIIMEPELLLFDEPLSNLDAKLREQMRIEIRALQKRLGITSVYVTHDQSEAMSISDRVVVMNHGRIEQVGTPRELYARPKNSFVAAFIGKANFLEGKVAGKDLVELGGRTFNMEGRLDSFKPDDPVKLIVRPEAVQLKEETENEDLLFPGEITRTTFLGNIVEYEVRSEDLPDLTIHKTNPITGRIFEPTEKVGISFVPATLHPLEEH